MRDIPEGLKRGVIIVVSTLFLVSLSLFFYLPKIKAIRRIKAEIAQAEKEINRIKAIERLQPSSQEEARWREVEFTTSLTLMLNSSAASNFLKTSWLLAWALGLMLNK